ncbi:MAG: heavy-metal-associated domain-containing protein [Alphaproteobacteria bacterium]|nr:heavy-metal-associated domain-containing protein [Alphaproteobacteria bacterium]
MLNLQVEGMTCGHCERTVTRAVRSIDPAAEVVVDRSSGRVTVQSSLDADAVRQAIESEGYRVT